jgi:hypothetical protein
MFSNVSANTATAIFRVNVLWEGNAGSLARYRSGRRWRLVVSNRTGEQTIGSFFSDHVTMKKVLATKW